MGELFKERFPIPLQNLVVKDKASDSTLKVVIRGFIYAKDLGRVWEDLFSKGLYKNPNTEQSLYYLIITEEQL